MSVKVHLLQRWCASVGEDTLYLTINATVDYSLGRVSIAAFHGVLTIVAHTLRLSQLAKLLRAVVSHPKFLLCLEVFSLGGVAVKQAAGYVCYILITVPTVQSTA